MNNIKELVGRIIYEVDPEGMGFIGAEEIKFYTTCPHCNGIRVFKMYHRQECCESVWLEDIYNLDNMLDSEVISAEEVTNDDNPLERNDDRCDDSFIWTFYNITTKKGTTTLRWYGTSNGYYSESVDFKEISHLKEE